MDKKLKDKIALVHRRLADCLTSAVKSDVQKQHVEALVKMLGESNVLNWHISAFYELHCQVKMKPDLQTDVDDNRCVASVAYSAKPNEVVVFTFENQNGVVDKKCEIHRMVKCDPLLDEMGPMNVVKIPY